METPGRRPDPTAPKSDKTDLEVFLRVRGPELFQKHAANILMIALLLIAAAMFLYTRSRNRAAEQAATNQNTAIAYDFAQQTREMFGAPVFNDAAARDRQTKVRDVFSAVELVLTSDADASQKAAAQLAKADVLWQLANAPEASLATTQPATGFSVKAPSAYLDDAESAYTDLLSKYANEKEYAANALIGLAAVAETRRDFDKAKAWYDKVTGDPSLRPVYHEMAASRAKMLDDLRKPFTIARPTSQPATQSATVPAELPSFAAPAPIPATSSTTVPTMMPTTVPAGM